MPRAQTTRTLCETEKGFQAAVIALAQRTGWLTYHTWRSIHSPAGFPDLVLCRPPRLIFAELKSATGKVTASQQQWLAVLGQVAGEVEAYLWRPADFDEIVTLLQRR